MATRPRVRTPAAMANTAKMALLSPPVGPPAVTVIAVMSTIHCQYYRAFVRTFR